MPPAPVIKGADHACRNAVRPLASTPRLFDTYRRTWDVPATHHPVGDRDRRLLGRHAAEQLRDPGIPVRADLRQAHDGHRAGGREVSADSDRPSWKALLA